MDERYIRLSQGHLNLLALCPRKFQHAFLDQLSAPPTPKQQEKQLWGTQFHLLMQQRQLDLPVERLAQTDPPLQQCLAALAQAAPEIVAPVAGDGDRDRTLRQSEHLRSLRFGSWLLVAVYDLLIAAPDRAQILDWKTYPQRPSTQTRLAKDWQTRLYPFLLAETSRYRSEQISMTYWFVQGRSPSEPPQPQQLTFPYSQSLHEQTRQELNDRLDRLGQWLAAYQQQDEPFPQVEASEPCQFCSFAARCQRGDFSGRATPETATLTNLDAIKEIPLPEIV